MIVFLVDLGNESRSFVIVIVFITRSTIARMDARSSVTVEFELQIRR